VLTLNMSVEHDFYLLICDPRKFKCLKSESTETNVIVAIRYSFHSSSVLFAKFCSF
jgi:hypothetical protein